MNTPFENNQKTHTKSKSLKYVLLANGTFSSISGIILLLIPQVISDLLGTTNLMPEWVFPIGGANLVVFGGALYAVAMQTLISKFWVNTAIVLDASWVIGSMIITVLFYNLLSNMALIIISCVAFIVAIFAFLQRHYLNKKPSDTYIDY